MTVIHHDQLGRLDVDESGVADTTVALGNRRIAVDVNFDDGVDVDALEEPARRVGEIAALDAAAREAMRKDLRGDEDAAVPLYRSHHFAELDSAVLCRVFSVDSVDAIDDETFVATMKLVRIGIYPDAEDATIVCDYSIDPEVTNYLIAVIFDADGEVADVSLES